MLDIPGYVITKELFQGANSSVYCALRQSDNQSVILKQLREDYSTPAELTRYQQEYDIIHTLSPVAGVIRIYELEKYQNMPYLIMEDFGGNSLKQLYGAQSLNLSQFLSIAIKLSQALGEVHAANVIHKDINPSNVVFNPTTGQLKLIDFGIATRLPRENPTLKNPNQLEGTLPYLSPEQTGRMNRSLDYRTDLYSMGITCYELLTGRLPFVAEDAMELVHCHLAKPPLPPHLVNPLIPPVLSEIVLKLLAKTAENRYQSAWGLKHDLEECQRQLTSTAQINTFPLAQQDLSGHFHLPQQLYGREEEIQQLLAAFDTVVQGHSQLFLVAGYSGIGKSVLVQEVYKPITERRGYFIAGKFDQFQRNVPYFAVIQAFRDLVRQLLTETSSQLNVWKTQILTAVGNNGQIMMEVIPEIELIIGPQPVVPLLPPTESQNRFNWVFQNFIKAFCQANHPLVIFLDDLQWIDPASLKLMTLMMSDIPYLLLIGAYRDNEVSPLHPLITTLAEMQQSGFLVQTVTLTPLTLPHLNQLVSDTLHLPTASTLPLAELVLEKTGGNPFFAGEFLKTLYVEQLLNFNSSNFEWQWDLAHIRARNITDNVVELMTGKIQRLPHPTQVILKLAASIGNQFDLATLAVISPTPVESVTTDLGDLWEALVAGLVVPLEKNYKFVHDRVQQSAYSLIPEEERPALHWQIGQLLKIHWGESLEERLFEVLDHLNQGSSLATTPAEQMQLVRLNLQAGQKAKLTTAYRTAAEYLRHGHHWLTPAHWQTDYELTLFWHLEMVEVSYLCGDFDQMEAVAELVLQQARTPLDKVKVYESRISAYMSQALPLQAIQTGREGLALFEVVLPEKPTAADIASALTDTAARWQSAPISELVNLPRMTAAHWRAVMRILSLNTSSCMAGMPELFSLIVSKMINLSIEHGSTEQSPFAYANYGVILGGAMEIEAAYQFGQLAIQGLERLKAQMVNRARTFEIVYVFINPWKEHLSAICLHLKEVYQFAIEEGDLEYVGYTAVAHSAYTYLSGQPLVEVEYRLASYLQELAALKQDNCINYLAIYQQSVLTLLQAKLPGTVTELSAESKKLLGVLQQANDYFALFPFYTNRLFLCYLFQEVSQALENANLAKNYLAGAMNHGILATFNFYDSLAHLASYLDAHSAKRDEILQPVSANQDQMKQWAQHAPMNYQHKYDLVEAEKARVLGQNWKAMESYEKAMAGARKNGYLQEEALAYELTAKFYLAHKMEKVAQTYLQEAYHAYQRWGATAKVQHLQTQYPQLLAKWSTATNQSHTRMITNATLSTSTTGSQSLDLNSIIKASQTLSGEIILQRLLEKMMHIVIENAGAEQGFLLLPKQNQWLIEAEGRVGKADVVVLQSIPIDDNRWVSSALIYYVVRTQQPLVLNAATKSGYFTRDPHIIQSQVKSVLGMPLLNQGKLVGILYLENNLVEGAFTTNRIEILNFLSSQLAISIQNAKLYAEVRENERTLAQFLDAMPVGVVILEPGGKPYFVNQRGQELLGQGVIQDVQHAQLAQTYKLYLAGTDQVYPVENLPAVKALQGEQVSREDIEVHQPSRVVPLEVWGMPIFDHQSQIIYAMAAFQDISDRKQAEANKIRLVQEQEAKNAAVRYGQEIEAKNVELAKTLQQLKTTQAQLIEAEKMASLGNLVAGVAHEINTPIGIGITAASALEDKTKTAALAYDNKQLKSSELKTYFDIATRSSRLILNNLERAGELVQSFKQVAVDQSHLDRRRFVVKKYLQDTLINLTPHLKRSSHRILVHGDEQLEMNSYPGAFSQIITNLVMNALQHAYLEGQVGQISFEVRGEGEQVILEYQDDGRGIPPEHLGKIFEPFFTTRRNQGGTGLGLHIVYNLVTQKLKGTIRCESELLVGTTFILKLPIQLAASH
jgi:PAS domain S-box-containing protein